MDLALFSSKHLILLLVVLITTLVGISIFHVFRFNRKFEIFVGFFVLVKTSIFTCLGPSVAGIGIFENLPLHMCDITAVLCSIFLIKPSKLYFEYIIFFGWVGALNAVLTPKFIHGDHTVFVLDYIFQHSFIFVVTVYLVFYQKNRLSSKSLFRSILLTIFGIVIPVHLFNLFFGTNYFFTIEPPFKEHPLIIGAWPWYLFGFILTGVLGAILVNYCYKNLLKQYDFTKN